MKRNTEPFGECAWCRRPIRYGERSASINHHLEDAEWDEALEHAAVTVHDAVVLLVLCASCGDTLNVERLEAMLQGAAEALRMPGPEPFAQLPPAGGERTAWTQHPHEAAAYAEYLREVMAKATAMLWRYTADEGGEEPGGPEITNAVIDYTSDYEGTPAHDGYDHDADRAGWIDPSYTNVGSCSRQFSDAKVLQDEPCHVTLNDRELSLVTLDRPTWIPPDDSGSFYQEVIRPLMALEPGDDDLYGWLTLFFRFCSGKPVAYFSRYTPGPKIYAVAARAGVSLFQLPLDTIPEALREQHRKFRFLNLTKTQWNALVERLGE